MPSSYSSSYAANAAVRVVLQKAGAQHDVTSCGNHPLTTRKGQLAHRAKALSFFMNKCCYCDASFDDVRPQREHIVPMNMKYLGLNCWRNVVFCCGSCNQRRGRFQDFPLDEFLPGKKKLVDRISKWQSQYPSEITLQQKIRNSVMQLHRGITRLIEKHLSALEA